MDDKAREVKPDYVARLFQQRSDARMIRFDEQTVAGVLMASEDPRRVLPNAFIQAVAYRGTSGSLQVTGSRRWPASSSPGYWLAAGCSNIGT